ncbi:hypothetical protein FRC05_003813 [Tulasnella sp. 425]|nr:hypothetical protein FRC05_003813 [Tulasnella sp. 425]
MVVTRSKTLTVSKKPGDETVEGWNRLGNGVGTSGSLDDEYQSKPKRKRAKTARSARTSEESRDRLREDRFNSLPLDVVYEILGFLTPLDLLHLARTNKALRNHFMSKRSRGAWKAARAAAEPPVPTCPKDLSEPQLAVLLFARECTLCSKPLTGFPDVWWILRLRACKVCYKANTISGKAAAKEFAYLDDFRTVLELLPGECNWLRSQRRPDPYENHYLSEAVRQMSEIVEHHQLRFEARVEGSRTDFEKFVQKTKSEICEKIDSASILMKWAREREQAERRIANEIREKRREEYVPRLILGVQTKSMTSNRRVISKLVELGHDLRDARQASYAYSEIPNLFLTTQALTPAAWKRRQPRAERLVEEQKRIRTAREEDPVRKTRRTAFCQRYSSFKSSYNAVPDTLMPSATFLTKIESVKEIIEAEGTDVSPSIFDHVFSDLPNHLEKWRKERKLELTRLVLAAQQEQEADTDPEAAEEQGILSLATSVFSTCGHGYSLTHDEDTVHWIDTIGDHFSRRVYHTPPRKPTSSFEEMQCVRVLGGLVGHAKLLVEAVGLDPSTATTADMDDLNARFYCDDCSLVKLRGEVVARNWRNCTELLYASMRRNLEESGTLRRLGGIATQYP